MLKIKACSQVEALWRVLAHIPQFQNVGRRDSLSVDPLEIRYIHMCHGNETCDVLFCFQVVPYNRDIPLLIWHWTNVTMRYFVEASMLCDLGFSFVRWVQKSPLAFPRTKCPLPPFARIYKQTLVLPLNLKVSHSRPLDL